MSSTPTVSVVIPTYNAPRLLRETLNTVFTQTFQDFEVIVVNDGSTDDTLDQLQPLAVAHPDRLRIVTQSNAGVGAARNRGIDEARGKYIAFLDHDDWWRPDKLRTQVDFLELRPMCVAATVVHSESNTPDEVAVDKSSVVDERGIVRRPFRAMAAGLMLVKTCSVLMVHRERTRGLRFGTVRGAIEDTPYLIQLLGRGEVGIAGDTILAVWRRHAANFSGQSSYFFKGMRLLREMERQGAFSELTPEQSRDLADYLAQQGRVATVSQFPKFRLNALRLYLGEFGPQLRQRRWKFLLGFPLAWSRAMVLGR